MGTDQRARVEFTSSIRGGQVGVSVRRDLSTQIYRVSQKSSPEPKEEGGGRQSLQNDQTDNWELLVLWPLCGLRLSRSRRAPSASLHSGCRFSHPPPSPGPGSRVGRLEHPVEPSDRRYSWPSGCRRRGEGADCRGRRCVARQRG